MCRTLHPEIWWGLQTRGVHHNGICSSTADLAQVKYISSMYCDFWSLVHISVLWWYHLSNLQHRIASILFAERECTYVIENFGSDAFIYVYEKGVTVNRHGNGLIVRLPGTKGVARYKWVGWANTLWVAKMLWHNYNRPLAICVLLHI